MKNILLVFLFVCEFHFFTEAQSHYPGQHKGKFVMQDKVANTISAFDLQDVRLLDSRFKENMGREAKWIMSIDVNSLLHSFRTNAGVYSGEEGGYDDARRLAGWESLDCELRGHTTGHILSGLAFLYASTGEDKYKLKADSLVVGLAQVQKILNQDGYLSAFPQELINRNIAGQKVWAPWYTLHKILAGLIDQYLYCNNTQALNIATKIAQWSYKKLQPLTEEQRTKMLRNEFGGINECFYNLYAITGKQETKRLGDFFYQNEVMGELKKGIDNLAGKHANTYIPKLIGLSRDAEIEGNTNLDSIASFFWNAVIAHQTFCTGSNSDREHFIESDKISEHLTGYTGESCNVYNMLKLTRHLYQYSGNIKYTEYYEKALFNHILGQQDPQTGMVAYFLPMQSGAHKVYSTPDSSFWCCVGSSFENQTKYGEAIYYHAADNLFINLFISSELQWKEKNISIKQETSFPEDEKIIISVTSASNVPVALNIRYPLWATLGATIKVNGEKFNFKNQPGSYIIINRKWNAGDKVEIQFPMSLRIVPTNDNPKVASIVYGPIVLAGEMGTGNFIGRGPYSNPKLHNDYYTYDYHIPDNIKSTLSLDTNKLNDFIKPMEGKKLTFKTVNEQIILKPLYNIHRERYVIYWNLK